MKKIKVDESFLKENKNRELVRKEKKVITIKFQLPLNLKALATASEVEVNTAGLKINSIGAKLNIPLVGKKYILVTLKIDNRDGENAIRALDKIIKLGKLIKLDIQPEIIWE